MRTAFTVWCTGLPSSGKSALADALAPAIMARGFQVEVINSGRMRRTPLGASLGFSKDDRDTNVRRHAFAANLHNQVTPFSYKSLQQKEHLLASVRYHREIIEAIKKGDRSSACRLMKRHVLDALLVFRDMQDAVWDEVLPSSMVMEG